MKCTITGHNIDDWLFNVKDLERQGLYEFINGLFGTVQTLTVCDGEGRLVPNMDCII